MTHKAIDERHDNYIKYYDINNPIISIEKSIKMVLKIVIFENSVCLLPVDELQILNCGRGAADWRDK